MPKEKNGTKSLVVFEPGTQEVKELRLDFTDDPGNKLPAVPEAGSISKVNVKIHRKKSQKWEV